MPDMVGTPAGHEHVPAGVKAAVPFVPAGVYEWFAIEIPETADATLPEGVYAFIVNVGWLTVPLGVPADTFVVSPAVPVKVGCDTTPVGVKMCEACVCVELPPTAPTA